MSAASSELKFDNFVQIKNLLAFVGLLLPPQCRDVFMTCIFKQAGHFQGQNTNDLCYFWDVCCHGNPPAGQLN